MGPRARMAAAKPRRGRPPGGGAGQLLALIRKGKARTKAELGQATGFARATVTKQMGLLLRSRLVVLEGERVSAAAGRPAAHFAFNPAAGTILAVDVGVTGLFLAVTDLAGTPLVELEEPFDIARGPEQVLGHALTRWGELLRKAGRTRGDVRGVGVGVPAPVELGTGRPLSPPLMPGWDGFPIAEHLQRELGVPVLVDRSVNLMALAEAEALGDAEPHLVFVKAATGIGCGLIIAGQLHRGAIGAAGDIGHVPIADAGNVLCSCGQTGCLEAVAGAAAVARALTDLGVKTSSSREVSKHLRAGRPEAIKLVREAGRRLGQALSMVVAIVNPGLIVVGGDLADVGEHLITGVREVVLQRAQPIVTRSLRIVPSQLGHDAGVRGAARLAIDHVLAPAAVDRDLRDGHGRAR